MRVRVMIATLVMLFALQAAARAEDVRIESWSWSHDAGYIFVKGTMFNPLGWDMPVVLKLVEDGVVIHKYELIVSGKMPRTDFNYMVLQPQRPKNLKLEFNLKPTNY